MALDDFPLVDVGDISRQVGAGSFERGYHYALDGVVDNLAWQPDGVLTAKVNGSRPKPYDVEIELRPGRPGFWRIDFAACTCHVGYDCKHVAATLITADAYVIAALEEAGLLPEVISQQTAMLPPDPDAAPTSVAKPQPRAKPVPKWKSTLVPLPPEPVMVFTGYGRSGMEPPPETNIAMALQFEVREQLPKRRGRRWKPPTKPLTSESLTAAATARKAPVYELGVRPVMRSSSTGNWIKGNLSWNSIGYQAARLGLNPEQSAWFGQFAALYTSVSPGGFARDPDWFYLDDFDTPLFWNLLEQAALLGIQLVGSKKNAVIRIANSYELRLDASTGGVGSAKSTTSKRTVAAVQLTSRLFIDGQEHPAQNAGVIGGHGIYTFTLEPGVVYTLVKSSSSLTPEQRALVGRPATVTIPGRDVAEFLTDFFPKLRRTIAITSDDTSVVLPDFVPPVLVLVATFAPGHTLDLNWLWQYQHVGEIVRKPLRDGAVDTVSGDPQGTGAASLPDPGRDGAVESSILRLVETAISAEQSPGSASGILDSAGKLRAATVLVGLRAAEFTATTLAMLAARTDVVIDVIGDVPDYRELTETPQLTIKTVETDQQDWFDLGVLVSIEGKDIPFGPLFIALSAEEDMLLLEDNSYISLDQPVFTELKKLIHEASTVSEWKSGTPRISRYQASLWSELEGLAESTEQAEAWRTSVTGLLELGEVEPMPLPHGLEATLRPYQHEGFDWLVFLWMNQLGGVLADDMGLGKTLQALAMIRHASTLTRAIQDDSDRRPFLVVAPTSVVSNWVSEAERFTPGLVARGITTTQAKGAVPLGQIFSGADIVVTSYALFRLDFALYQDHGWAGLILDEAQFVKNPMSKAHQCAVDLRAPFKLAITGTPMENSLTDLWSLFSIVAPGLFPSGSRFVDEYVKPITRGDDDSSERLGRLRRRIRPLMMRRTKELVAKDLPAKQEQVLRIELTPKHRKLYDTYLQRERKKLLGLIDDLDKNRFMVFRSLTLLRMLSLDASLVDDKYADIPSTKLDVLLEQLEDVVAEQHRALIFSQFTSFLKKTAERLDAEGIAYAYLDGSTLKRGEVIKKFKEGDAPVFLISLKAGGFGLNLTEADYVFLLDPWWNPATEAQAVDRTHRIGQVNNVMVYRMIATGTIEEKVMALKEKKSQLFDAVMDDDAVFSSALTADDIRGLLE